MFVVPKESYLRLRNRQADSITLIHAVEKVCIL